MDTNYELAYNENQEEDEEIVFENKRRQIANTLSQYLSSPIYEIEEKIDILLELLYQKNYDRKDYQNYYQYWIWSNRRRQKNSRLWNMFAIFREDNSFIIAKEESITNLPWRNGSIIKINDINSYIVPISLVIPAKHFLEYCSEIEKKNRTFKVTKNDELNSSRRIASSNEQTQSSKFWLK